MKKFLSLAAVLLAVVTINAQDPISVTCAEAAAAMPATKNQSTADTYIITGYITETNGTISSEQQCFWMDDVKGSTKTIQGYWCDLPEGEKDIPLKVGDHITLTGKIMNYNNTPEVKNGQVAILERAEVVPLDTITVSEAIARLNDDVANEGACYVKGKVLSIISTNVEKYGNISYWMADTNNPNDSLQAYRMNGANNAKYANTGDIEFIEGDEILVYAAGLTMYEKDSTTYIPELNTGYYVRTISGAEIVNLDWTLGSAYREEGTWELEIGENENNFISLIFNSTEDHAIAGFHNLNEKSSITINSVETDIISGSVQLEFKEVNTSTGYNVYTVKVSAIAGEKVYRMNGDVEFYASMDGDEIDLDGDRPFVPNPGDTITCAQAREYVLSLPESVDGMTITVRGFVTEIVNNGSVYNTFWMDDEKGSKKTFEVAFYKELLPLGVQLAKGDEVIATGVALNYKGTTPEIKNGTVTVQGAEVEIAHVSVAQALELAQALDTNTVTTEYYEVEAFIASIAYAYSEQYGNISLWLTDNADDHSETFQAYRAKCDSAIVDQLVAGAKIYVIGNLKHHYSAEKLDSTGAVIPERHSYEVVNGTISLHATAVENVVVTKEEVVKFFKNGQIYIRRNDGLYNIQGIKVD